MGFSRWCKRTRMRPRFGAAGKHGGIAVVERLIRTMKDEGTRKSLMSPRQASSRWEFTSFFAWYNEHRPRTTLLGKTPFKGYSFFDTANCPIPCP